MSNDVEDMIKIFRKEEFEKNIKSIKEIYECTERMNTILQEKNYQLKEEYDKDEEIQKMKIKLEEMRSSIYRGFPISEEEEKRIQEWKEKHEKEAHNGSSYAGAIGGRYSYYFVPTSIGTSGTIKCNCGAEFEFQEIG